MNYKGLTIRYNGLSNVIKCDIGLCKPFNPPSPPPLIKNYNAIWDTGATCSVISEKVVKELGLQHTTFTKVSTGHDTKYEPTYLINLLLPDNVMVMGIKAVKLNINMADVLIGMDVIVLGDFAISNYDKKTTMSFRLPSAYEVDYVQEIQISRLPRNQRRQLERKNKKRLA